MSQILIFDIPAKEDAHAPMRTLDFVATGFSLVGKSAITGSFSTVFLYTPEIYPTNYRSVYTGSVPNQLQVTTHEECTKPTTGQ